MPSSKKLSLRKETLLALSEARVLDVRGAATCGAFCTDIITVVAASWANSCSLCNSKAGECLNRTAR